MITEDKSSENEALLLVFARNSFYKRLHYLVLGALTLSVLIIALLIWVVSMLINNPTPPLYFATDKVSHLITIIPVGQPNMSNDDVISWTKEAVQNAFSYDYVNYRAQLQSTQKYFTKYAWTNYMRSLTSTSNLLALTERKLVVTAQVVGDVKILAQGKLSGSFAWKFEMPLLVIYWYPPYDELSKVPNAYTVSVIVQRQDVLQSYKGLGILQLIATYTNA